jgi:hypothetical protein
MTGVVVKANLKVVIQYFFGDTENIHTFGW